MPFRLDKNERIALFYAMKLVLTSFDEWTPAEIVVEQILEEDSDIAVWNFFANLPKRDVYNIIWHFQETIYEAMSRADFIPDKTNGLRP